MGVLGIILARQPGLPGLTPRLVGCPSHDYNGVNNRAKLPRTVNARFYIDPETGYPHIYGHGVEEHEVEYVLASPSEDRPGRDNSRVAIGRTQGGRYLRVIYVIDPEPDHVFVVTAYELKGKPLTAYRRRMRRRGR